MTDVTLVLLPTVNGTVAVNPAHIHTIDPDDDGCQITGSQYTNLARLECTVEEAVKMLAVAGVSYYRAQAPYKEEQEGE